MDAIYEAAFNKAGVIRVDSSLELLDVAIGLMTQPRPRGRNVIITTPGGSYGVMCADACSSLGLNVIDLPVQVMEVFNTMFPPRWSHGNPVDPAGDRDFIQYLRAPEIVLKQPEVDALIFMGFGSFSSMSSVFAPEGRGQKQVFVVSRERMEDLQTMARNFLDILDSGDRARIGEFIKAGLKMLFSSVTVTKTEDLEEFLGTVSRAITTEKRMESSFYHKLRSLLTSLAGGDVGAIKMAGIVELIDPLLDSIIDSWIVQYGKPVITTTFTERTSQISEGGHFPYPNAERAATVLAKLVRYSEYLDKEGSY